MEPILVSIRQNGPGSIAIPAWPESLTGSASNATVPQEEQLPFQTSGSYSDSTNQADSEALPSEADGFDWTENEIDLHTLSDGMAALSIKPEGAGYLGK